MKYIYFFSARRVSRYAGMDVIDFKINNPNNLLQRVAGDEELNNSKIPLWDHPDFS